MTAVEIDPSTLPQRALFDTGVVIRALGERPDDPRAPTCEALWNAMLESNREILIAAPSLAEMIRQAGKEYTIPRRRGVEVVAFDDRAAVELGRRFPKSVLDLERAKGLPHHYIKYDALIVACAIRHRASHLVSLDGALTGFAAAANIQIVAPDRFEKPQMRLPKIE